MTPSQKFLALVVIPLTAVLAITLWVYILVGLDSAYIVSLAGPGLVLTCNLIYIIFLDSRKEWPGASVKERAARVFTLDYRK